MTLETTNDARRVARASRAECDDLLAYLEQLPAEGWTEQSACADWKVYQVISHLSSGQQINQARLEAALRGTKPMSDDQRQAIWDYFDSLPPDQMLPDFHKANEDYFALVETLSAHELGQTIPWFLGPVPVATALTTRLNEQALHAWDVRWARDQQATLSPAGVPELLELALTSGGVSRLANKEEASKVAGQRFQLLLSQPDGELVLEFQSDGVSARRGRVTDPELTARLPAEALCRMIWGRYDLAVAIDSGEAQLSKPELAEPLKALFPGR